ncbi:hypothetical protein ZWY2020_044832 [Hordeum vulgare]|nr:hypothetical protein ZWY2020_044832 [Hordeum vulgare]
MQRKPPRSRIVAASPVRCACAVLPADGRRPNRPSFTAKVALGIGSTGQSHLLRFPNFKFSIEIKIEGI